MLQINSLYLEIVRELGLLIVFSIMIRQAIMLNSQNWVKSFSSSLTLLLLPIVTYGVTSVISGNIALSLGLVGALSIVRFRNPVRSSFELSILFLYISLGITASANIKYLVLLGVTSLVVLVGASVFAKIYRKTTGQNYFSLSFSEANYTCTLEVETSKPHANLEDEKTFITGISNFDNSTYSYRFASDNFLELKELKARIEKMGDLNSIRISQV